ncbi:hypothetical protein EUGRSUZ_E00737 [Eucalyptus grandis]|uniref:Uncharacterized protein n=2 Tax=Eucalyptus grandis TaxID=71139 RepID=A0ACC3KSE9_EUCGR|nr:hypothetical protein EUGRSUZ_E00737 [Eucalyptus grandis]
MTFASSKNINIKFRSRDFIKIEEQMMVNLEVLFSETKTFNERQIVPTKQHLFFCENVMPNRSGCDE